MAKVMGRNLSRMAVSGSALADLVGDNKMAVSRLEKAGVLKRDADGLFPLRDSVRAMFASRSDGDQPTSMDRDMALKVHWQAKNEMTKNLLWCARYGQRVADGVVMAMEEYFEKCRNALTPYPEACAILAKLSADMKKVDINALISECVAEEFPDTPDSD